MALTHAQKRSRIGAPPLSDLAWAMAGAVAYAAVGTAFARLFPAMGFLRPAAAVLVLAALLRGPVVGFGTGFLGDLLLGLWLGSASGGAAGGVWLHWSLGAGLAGALIGLLWLWSDLDATPALTGVDLQKIAFFTCVGFFAGAFVPAVIDAVLGASLSLALLVWALPAWLLNFFWGTVLGTLLLVLGKYAAGRRLVRRSARRRAATTRRGE